MSHWFHRGGLPPVAKGRAKEADWIKAEVDSLNSKARKLAESAEQLLADVEVLVKRGGLEHVKDDFGDKFSDAQDFITRGLGLDFQFAPQKCNEDEQDDDDE